MDRDGRRVRLRAAQDCSPLEPPSEAKPLLELARRACLTIGELAMELGWTRRKAGYWVHELQRRGFVHVERAGRARRVRAGPAG